MRGFAVLPVCALLGVLAIGGDKALEALGPETLTTWRALAADPEALRAWAAGAPRSGPSADGEAATPLARMFEDAPGPGRVVALSERYPFEALLASGEAAPAPELRPLWAAARAPARAADLCGGLVGDLARSCDVRRAHTRLEGEEVVAEVELGIVPAFEMGAPSEAPGARIARTAPVPLAGPRSAAPEARDDAAARARVFAEIAAACGRLRATYGNCVPAELTLGAIPAEGGDLLRAEVRYAVHAAGVDGAELAAAAAP